MDFRKVNITDIETPKQCFLLCAYNIETQQDVQFLINHKQNDLYLLIKWLSENKDLPMVGWNILGFDIQVLEWVYRNYHEWYDLTGLEIANLIHHEANLVIDNSKYGVFPRYREEDLHFKVIDLFKIHHGDNKNRMASMSLKCMEFYLDRNIEVFEWDNQNDTFTDEEIDKLISYCKNEDVVTTAEMYLLTLGKTENSVYKDNNQVEIRESINEEFKIPCMNYSDAKIGDEIVKQFYCEEKGIKYEDLPRKGYFRKHIILAKSVPDYIKFETLQLQELLKEIKTTILKQDEDYHKQFKFFNETFVLARGGLHSKSENKSYHSDEEYVIADVDVASYYVKIPIERGYYPEHLGRPFLIGNKKIYDKRVALKPLAKKDKKIKGIVLGLKNGGVAVYGKSADRDSWLFDKQFTSNVCISGELSLLMIIEQQELLGNKCIMANTDGATFIVKRKELDKFKEVCQAWEKMTGYELEYTYFKSLWFSNVNNYIGIKDDDTIKDEKDKIKKKGDTFLTDYEIFKDKSNRVIPLALEAYYIKGIDPEEFINKHDNMFDFCARGKVNKDFYLEAVTNPKNIKVTDEDLAKIGWKLGKTYGDFDEWYNSEGRTDMQADIGEILKQKIEKESRVKYNKLIRYYAAKEGIKLYKIKRPSCRTNAAKVSEVLADHCCQVVWNNPVNADEHLKNVDRQFYIDKVKAIIFKIKENRKPKKGGNNPNQISMF